MVAEGKMFAAEDLLHTKRSGALNDLSNFVSGLKSQLSEKLGFLPMKKKKLEEVVKDELKGKETMQAWRIWKRNLLLCFDLS